MIQAMSFEKKVQSKQHDFKLVTKHTRWLFQILGLWIVITGCFTFKEKFLSILTNIICVFLMLVVLVPSFCYLLLTDEELPIKLSVFGPIGVTIICALKYCSIVHNRKNIKNCLIRIQRDWEKIDNCKDRVIMTQSVNKGNNVTIIFAIFMFTGGISHQIAAPFLPGSLVSILKNSSERPLVFPVNIINSVFDTQKTPIYEIIYFLHILLGAVVCTMSVGACNIGAILVTHVCGRIQIIISKLEKLVDSKNLQNNLHKKKIAEIIDLHNSVVKFSLEIQNIMGEICLIEIIGGTLIICIVEYYCLMAWEYHERAGFLIYFILFFAFTFNVFIFCYIGELLKDQVGKSIYMSKWHYLKPHNARDFIFMICMAQHPIKLTANGFMELSCNGFTTVMKTTITFFNILRMIEL